MQGVSVQKSLFERVYNADLNNDERRFAVFLDGNETLSWWYRNIARQHYGLSGWKKDRIYPDFIFYIAKDDRAKGLFVIETKGEFLDGTEDTEYKRQLLDFLTDNFDWDNTVDAGELAFERDGTQLVCKLILTNEYETELPPLIANLAETPPSS